MTHYDVFNGDADGICALQQLRLADPIDSYLITGVKRDIQLLDRVYANQDDVVTVLDISLDKNRKGLEILLDKSVTVNYFDHHFTGDLPVHSRFTSYIDTAADTCTSLLVDNYLKGKHRLWAIVGAFGDNFDDSARRAASLFSSDNALSEEQLISLRELGVLLNYNGYGMEVGELHFHPEKLFRELHPYETPFDFIRESKSFRTLRNGYEDDMAKAINLSPELETDKLASYILPAEKWASRVSGVYGNKLASDAPDRAHALLTKLPEGGYRISVRAPTSSKEGADELCRQFKTGGGRKAAAGINALPEHDYDRFIEKFTEVFS